MTARRTTFLFTALGLLTAALFIADLAVGSVAVPLGDVWAALTGGSCAPATSDIILKIRLLKAVTALFAGAALAAGGLEMQTLFRNPLAGPYVLGVSSGAGLGVALFLLGAPLLGVAGHSFVRSLGVAGAAWLGSRAGHRDGGQPPHQGHHGHPHPRHDARFGHQFGGRNPPIPVERGGAQIVRHLDHGVAGRRHGQPARAAASRRHRGTGARRRRHQAAQPAAARRELCPHDGTQRAAHAHADLPLHGPARGHRHRLLRPGGFHRAGRAAPRTHAFRLGRPPHPDAGVDARGRGPASGLRPRRQEPRPADQHHHGPDGHSGRHLRRRPQPQYLLT